jgi:hypothetical protein
MLHQKTRALGALLSLVAIAASALVGCDDLTINLTIDRSRIQERVEKKFPVEQKMDPVTVVLSNPVVDFKAGPDRIGLTTDVKVGRDGGLLAVTGKARSSGKVRYEPSDSTFYLTEVKIEEVDLPLKFANEARRTRTRELVNATVEGSLKDIPLDSLQNKSAKEAAGALIKSVKVKDDKLVIQMSFGQKSK